MRYLELDEVLAAHAKVKGITLGEARDHVRRLALLESALARPRNVAQYEAADMASQAATLLWGLVRNHPFVDGNKRTAAIVTEVFLDINGYDWLMDEDQRFDLLTGVANRALSAEQAATQLRALIRRRKRRREGYRP